MRHGACCMLHVHWKSHVVSRLCPQWYPEISQYPKDGTKVPIILVGTKLDLRDDEPTIAMLGNSSLVRITTMQVTAGFLLGSAWMGR